MSVEAKKGAIVLKVYHEPKLRVLGVVLSFKAPGCWCCLAKIKQEFVNECCNPACHASAVCYGMFEKVRGKLSGDVLAIKSSSVSSLKCNMHSGYFSISWKTNGNLSSLRKTVAMALSVMKPMSVYQSYEKYIGQGSKANKPAFLWCVKQIQDGMKSIYVTAVGKCALKSKSKPNASNNLQLVVNMIATKVSKPMSVKGEKKPEIHTKCDHTAYGHANALGWDGYLIARYIDDKLKGIHVHVTEQGVLVKTDKKRWDTYSPKLKADSKINPYVSRLGKLKHLLSAYLAFDAIEQGNLCAHAVARILKDKPTSNTIKSLIKKAL